MLTYIEYLTLRYDMDIKDIDNFINEKLQRQIDSKISIDDFYKAYEQYCLERGYKKKNIRSQKLISLYLKNNVKTFNIEYIKDSIKGLKIKQNNIKEGGQ